MKIYVYVYARLNDIILTRASEIRRDQRYSRLSIPPLDYEVLGWLSNIARLLLEELF